MENLKGLLEAIKAIIAAIKKLLAALGFGKDATKAE